MYSALKYWTTQPQLGKEFKKSNDDKKEEMGSKTKSVP
jgi:hypothetical protein